MLLERHNTSKSYQEFKFLRMKEKDNTEGTSRAAKGSYLAHKEWLGLRALRTDRPWRETEGNQNRIWIREGRAAGGGQESRDEDTGDDD